MIFSKLGRYLGKTYAVNFLSLLAILLLIVYVFDTIELIRRAEKQDSVGLALVLQMGLLKLPEVGQLLLPFAVLFSAIFSFWQLSRRSELIIVRTSGYSVWQFLAPFLFVGVVLGALQMAVINPVGALLVGKFERMENKYLSHQDNQIALFEEGLWLRQSQIPSDPDSGEFNEDAGYYVLHAGKINPKTWMLDRVMVLSFNQNDNFVRRIDAGTGQLEDGRWVFKDALVHSERSNRRAFELNDTRDMQERYVLPTNLTPKDIEDSFASTATMSFWHLPAYIKTLQQTGFDAANIKVHYQNIMSKPLMFCAMILLAAALTLKQTRLGNSLFLIILAVVIGFTIFFASSFLQALGASSQIPVFLAAWAAPAICFFAGLGVILTIEDG